MGKKKKKKKSEGSYSGRLKDTIPVTEILQLARLEKLKKREDSQRRNNISFTIEQIKAFASGVVFKKNTPEREALIREGIKNAKPILTKTEERIIKPERIKRSLYELWYEKVTAEQKEEKVTPEREEIAELKKEDKLEYQVEERVEPLKEEVKKAETPSVSIDFDSIYSVFKNVSTSYKYFWFMSLLSIIKRKGHKVISLSEMSAEMMALAWPYVHEYELDLGKEDSFEKMAKILIRQTSLVEKSTINNVRYFINEHYSLVKKILSPLLENVPYRFLSPWIKFVSKDDVIKKSNEESCACPYAFVDDNIVFDEDWYDYIHDNLDKLDKFVKKSLLEYLKKRNSMMALLKYKLKNITI